MKDLLPNWVLDLTWDSVVKALLIVAAFGLFGWVRWGYAGTIPSGILLAVGGSMVFVVAVWII